MVKILTPEEKLEIISLVTTSRTKDELEASINNYFKKEVKEEISIMPNKEIEPPIEIKKDSPFDASIYDSKYIDLVEEDRLKHPRTNEKLKIELPEEFISPDLIKSTSPSPSLSEEIIINEQPKTLEKRINNPWAESGARTVLPGELKL
ncbi:MAG: hypothetical protein ACI4U4_00975 [Bacilli bacterium]